MSTGGWAPSKLAAPGTTPSSDGRGRARAEERLDRRVLGVAIGRALGTVVVTLHGELNATTSPQLAGILRDLIDHQGNLSVVVDAHDLTVSGRDAAAVFVVAGEWARRHGGTLSVARATPPVRRALTESGVRDPVRFTDGASPGHH